MSFSSALRREESGELHFCAEPSVVPKLVEIKDAFDYRKISAILFLTSTPSVFVYAYLFLIHHSSKEKALFNQQQLIFPFPFFYSISDRIDFRCGLLLRSTAERENEIRPFR